MFRLLCVSFIVVLLAQEGQADDCQRCEGLQMPGWDCLLDWETFETYVANVTWKGIFSIREEADTRPTPIKVSIRWDILPDSTVRRLATFANQAGQCIRLNSTFGGGACSGVGKLESRGVFTTQSAGDIPGPRVDLFASSDPEKYVIVIMCFDDSSRCNGLCPNAQTTVLLKDQREDSDNDGHPDGDIILDEIPWCEIKTVLNECFDLSFVGNATIRSIRWAWTGHECKLEF